MKTYIIAIIAALSIVFVSASSGPSQAQKLGTYTTIEAQYTGMSAVANPASASLFQANKVPANKEEAQQYVDYMFEVLCHFQKIVPKMLACADADDQCRTDALGAKFAPKTTLKAELYANNAVENAMKYFIYQYVKSTGSMDDDAFKAALQGAIDHFDGKMQALVPPVSDYKKPDAKCPSGGDSTMIIIVVVVILVVLIGAAVAFFIYRKKNASAKL